MHYKEFYHQKDKAIPIKGCYDYNQILKYYEDLRWPTRQLEDRYGKLGYEKLQSALINTGVTYLDDDYDMIDHDHERSGTVYSSASCDNIVQMI